jgi:hypothetical protein
MSSVHSGLKQVPANAGYYIAVAQLTTTNTYLNTGTDSAPTIATFSALPSAPLAVGTILKDMGKTLMSAGHTFRKVQLRATASGTGPVWPDLGTDGVPTGSTDKTFYVALPGQHGISAGGTAVAATPVARLG